MAAPADCVALQSSKQARLIGIGFAGEPIIRGLEGVDWRPRSGRNPWRRLKAAAPHAYVCGGRSGLSICRQNETDGRTEGL